MKKKYTEEELNEIVNYEKAKLNDYYINCKIKYEMDFEKSYKAKIEKAEKDIEDLSYENFKLKAENAALRRIISEGAEKNE